MRCVLLLLFFFFFQAEDGIRDYKVTGVQTCALPICPGEPGDPVLQPVELARGVESADQRADRRAAHQVGLYAALLERADRSEERRVGKECRSRWSPYH